MPGFTPIDLYNQSAIIPATLMTDGPISGFYSVYYSILTTAGDAVLPASMTVRVTYNDELGSTFFDGAPVSLESIGSKDSGSFHFYLNNGNITIETTIVSGDVDESRYSLHARLEPRG